MLDIDYSLYVDTCCKEYNHYLDIVMETFSPFVPDSNVYQEYFAALEDDLFFPIEIYVGENIKQIVIDYDCTLRAQSYVYLFNHSN